MQPSRAAAGTRRERQAAALCGIALLNGHTESRSTSPGSDARLFIAWRPPHSRQSSISTRHGRCCQCGFRVAEPEELDFLEQIALFRNARIVVGQMRAARP